VTHQSYVPLDFERASFVPQLVFSQEWPTVPPLHPYGQTKALAKTRQKVAIPLAGGHFKLKIPESVI
jgi:hypothetical protein